MEAYQQAASSNNQYLKIISDHIKELDKAAKGKSISCIDQTGQPCQNDSSSETKLDESSNESEVAVRVVEDTFEESGPLTINKLHQWKQGNTRNYYPKPTPPDIQFEERRPFASSSFDGKALYQWNIDGKSEHEILLTLQKIWMAF